MHARGVAFSMLYFRIALSLSVSYILLLRLLKFPVSQEILHSLWSYSTKIDFVRYH